MRNEVMRLTKGDLTKFTENTPFLQHHENCLNPDLPTYIEASEAIKKLCEAIAEQPKCKHGIWLNSECKECSKECRKEFFKDSIGKVHE